MEPVVASVLIALAIVALLRRPGVFSPALVMERIAAAAAPGDEDEQLPETDRAPRPWLPWAVAAVAALRVGLLVTLHA